MQRRENTIGKRLKKVVAVLFLIVLVAHLGTDIVEAKIKTYCTEEKVVMTGKIKKVKYYMWNGRCEINYVLYTNEKFKVKDTEQNKSWINPDKQYRLSVLISKKQWKKYKNKKVKIKGILGNSSPHFCTDYEIYDIKKIQKVKKK